MNKARRASLPSLYIRSMTTILAASASKVLATAFELKKTLYLYRFQAQFLSNVVRGMRTLTGHECLHSEH